MQPRQTMTTDQEMLVRTRSIDANTSQLLPLLELLEPPAEGPGPLESLRETLVEILISQRETGQRLSRIERMLTRRENHSAGGAPSA